MPSGSKPGERRGGRKAGTPNKSNKARIEAARSSGLLPHDFLLAVTRGELIDGYMPTFADRLEAAKAGANYFAPKLATVEYQNGEDGPFKIIITSADAEL